MNHRILLAKLHLYGIQGVPEDRGTEYIIKTTQSSVIRKHPTFSFRNITVNIN